MEAVSYQPSEIAVLILAVFAALCIAGQREWLKKWQFARTAMAWFLLQTGAWLCSVLEGIAYGPVFNLLEHVLFALAAVVAVIACQRLYDRVKAGELR
jgi:hypothetical protein